METFTPNSQDNQRQVTDEELQQAIVTILRAIGEDPTREGLIGTPDRICRMYKEIFRGYDSSQKPRITTFENDSHSTELVFDTGDFYSMCEHHMMPFFGKYYFAYMPSDEGRILGISKIARVVGYCAARLQLQERLARDIIDMLDEALDHEALGFAIILKGQHMCKSMRGVKNPGPMSVSYYTGKFKTDASTRNEFLQMIQMNDR